MIHTHTIPLLQISADATGGSVLLVLLALLGLLLTAVLSLWVAYLVVRGYRQNPNRARLYLALGLLLLTTGPIVIRLVFSNLPHLSAVEQSAAANTSKLLGLGAMLYAIYGSAGRDGTAARGIGLAATTLSEKLLFLFPGVVGVVGLFVAYQAYRGFRRNASRPMIYLAIGIILLTAAPAALSIGLSAGTTIPDAMTLLLVTISHLTGVGAILYALRGA